MSSNNTKIIMSLFYLSSFQCSHLQWWTLWNHSWLTMMNQFTCKFHYLLFYCCEEALWPRELIKEMFILGVFFLEDSRVHNHDGRCMAAECLDLILKHEVERLLTGDDMGFWNQWHAFKKTALPNLFQTVPQTEE